MIQVDPSFRELVHSNPKYRCSKPVGYSWFPKELGPMPRAWVEKQGNLVWYRQHNAVGCMLSPWAPKLLSAASLVPNLGIVYLELLLLTRHLNGI